MADKTLQGAINTMKMEEMVKAVSGNPAYKVLTKEEYDILVSSTKGPSAKITNVKGDNTQTSTPKTVPQEFDGTRPKFTFTTPGASPVPRLNFNASALNTSFVPSPYVPKLPIFSGSEEPQKGETTYEVWSFEVKCLQNSSYLTDPSILLQAIRNSLRGTARSMLVSLGEKATVADILGKLDGFYGNVSSSETLIQSFYSDFQKENESVVSFGSRIEHTLSRAVASGHIDLIAKDAMLRSKFWTGLKSQSLKNSTRHLYDTIKDFQTLLREIRKVDQEESSVSSSKKQATQQQHSSKVSSESDNNTQLLLDKMPDLMGRMQKMEERLDQQSKATSEANSQSSFSPTFQNQPFPRNRGGYSNRGYYRGGYGRGYRGYNKQGNFQNQPSGQSDLHNTYNNNSSQRGFRGGGSQRGRRGGTSGRGAGRGENAANANPLNY